MEAEKTKSAKPTKQARKRVKRAHGGAKGGQSSIARGRAKRAKTIAAVAGPEYVTREEAARILSVGVHYTYRLVKDGWLHVCRAPASSKTFFRRDEVEKLLVPQPVEDAAS
jgi:hypothetical protein